MTKHSRYALLVFDWDGTLLDSAAKIVSCMQQSAQQCGLQPASAAEIRDVVGLSLELAIHRLYPDLSEQKHQAMVMCFRQVYLLDSGDEACLFDNALPALQSLQQQGYLLAVATGKSRRGLDKDLALTDTADLFPITRTAEETRSKPDPLMLEEILTDYDLSADQALMIGDTEYDLKMAANIRMDSLAVSYGMHDAERLWQARPKAILDDICQLIPWLKEQE